MLRGAEEACWAHNPKVLGSKPSGAKILDVAAGATWAPITSPCHKAIAYCINKLYFDIFPYSVNLKLNHVSKVHLMNITRTTSKQLLSNNYLRKKLILWLMFPAD